MLHRSVVLEVVLLNSPSRLVSTGLEAPDSGIVFDSCLGVPVDPLRFCA